MIDIKDDSLVAVGTLLSYRGTNKELCLSKRADSVNSIYRIGAGAFMHNQTLENLTIEDGVEEIGAYAFSECESLRSVRLSSNIRYIDPSAFLGDSGLKYVSLYVRVPDEKYRDITAHTLRLSNGDRVLDPMIFSRAQREFICSIIPDAVFDEFPLQEEMGYFVFDNTVFPFQSYLNEHGITEQDEMANEESVIMYRLKNESEQSPFASIEEANGEDSGFDQVQTTKDQNTKPIALTFLTKAIPSAGGDWLVKLIIKRGICCQHILFKVMLDEKTYYISFRVLFQNTRPTFILQESSMNVYTEEGSLQKTDPLYDAVVKKYEFVTSYL
ncbi:MAG: leucine-rich repeat domain-containing protein [Lachnospiraceae bacterium]|nr:leucine-rich repeat domain-containing protein [Lachnospiraceae bacterium]